MTSLQITPAELKRCRAQAHHLHPVVLIGADGLTEGVLKEAESALAAHGLIKVRIASDDRQTRADALRQLAEALGAAPVQQIGKLLVLWRPPAPKSTPARDDGGRGPKVVKIVKFSKSGNHRPQVKRVTVLGNQRIAAGGTVKRAHQRTASAKKRAAG